MNDAQKAYLLKMEARALKAGEAHHRCAAFFEALDTWAFAVPSLIMAFTATILSAVVLTDPAPSTGLRLAAVIVAATATALTAARNQVGAVSRAVNHQRSGVAFNAVRRKAATAASNEATQQREIDELNALYDDAGGSAPIVPRRIWKQADAHISGRQVQAGGAT